MEKRLYRSQSDRMIWGVCGGLAKYFDIDPTIVRVIAVLLVLVSGGAAVVAYIIMAIVIPLEGSKTAEPKDTVKENIEEIKETATELGRELRSTLSGKEGEAEEVARAHHRRRNLFGIILIVVGALFLAGTLLGGFNLLWWFSWSYLWPLVIVAIGVLLILSARGR